jgi:hypothetical protein
MHGGEGCQSPEQLGVTHDQEADQDGSRLSTTDVGAA